MVEESTLEGAVSIVTGGGGDIGTGIAAELAAAGSDVVIADVDVLETEYNQQASTEVGGIERTREVVDRVEERQRAHVVECDVTDAEQVQAMVEEMVDEFGRIDVVANNAGVITVAPVEEMAEAEWESIVDVNAKGVFLVARVVIPHLRDSNGTIVNTASIAGEIGAGGSLTTVRRNTRSSGSRSHWRWNSLLRSRSTPSVRVSSRRRCGRTC